LGGVGEVKFGILSTIAPLDHKSALLSWVVWMGAPTATTLKNLNGQKVTFCILACWGV